MHLSYMPLSCTFQPGPAFSCPTLCRPLTQPDSYYIQNNLIPITNLSFAGVLCPALLVACCMFYYRVYR